MESEFLHHFEELKRARSADREEAALQEILRVLVTADRLNVQGEVFDLIIELALKAKTLGVRYASIKALVSLFGVTKDVEPFLNEALVTICINYITDANTTLSCLCMLIIVLDSGDATMADFAVKKGALDIIFRLAEDIPAPVQQHSVEIRELCMTGLSALSRNPTYAKALHQKDVWTLLYRLYDDGYFGELSLTIVKNIVVKIGMPSSAAIPAGAVSGATSIARAGPRGESVPALTGSQSPSSRSRRGSRASRASRASRSSSLASAVEAGLAGEAGRSTPSEASLDVKASIRSAKSRLSQNISRELRSSASVDFAGALHEDEENPEEEGKAGSRKSKRSGSGSSSQPAEKAAPAYPGGVGPDDYNEDDGLINAQDLNEELLDLPSRICLHIDRKGIMSMLLSICQNYEQNPLAEFSLSILGLLASTMHRVIARDNRIIIVRVLLSLIEFAADSRLISVAYVLDSLLDQRASRGIVLLCGAPIKCAKTGERLLSRKDQTSKTICQCLTQLLFHVSQIPDGPAELSNPQCITFLQKSMRSIASTKLLKNAEGKDEWSSTVEVIALLTLINISVDSPVMSSVSEAHLHKALTTAANRTDELGFIAILGSAFFVGKSRGRVRSREFPRVRPAIADMLVKLLERSHNEEPTLGGILWSTGELLQAVYFLAQAPHNLYNLRTLLPSMVDTLQAAIDRDDAAIAEVAVEVLLTMSYNKHIMRSMTDDEKLFQVLDDAFQVVPYECVRSLETLQVSLENERAIRESQPARQTSTAEGLAAAIRTHGASLRERVSSLSRSGVKRLSFRKSLSTPQPMSQPLPDGPKAGVAFVVTNPKRVEEDTEL